jgi:hypothetical protein
MSCVVGFVSDIFSDIFSGFLHPKEKQIKRRGRMSFMFHVFCHFDEGKITSSES